MWPSRLTFMKVVFLINRYSPFVDSTLAVFSECSLPIETRESEN